MQNENDIGAGERGRRIIRELMGDEYVESRDKKRTPFNAVVQDYSDEVCFGRVWARPGIDRKLRSILNVVMLVALNRQGPLRTHVEGAIKSGWTVDELQEVLLHTAVYCGLPAAVEAFKIAEDVLKTKDLLPSD
jgi:4-carboxymuconolactone decarboxylase